MPRTTATSLFTPRKSGRADRKAARTAYTAARHRARKAEHTGRPRKTVGPDPELQPVFPASGRPGPASARGGKVRLPSHRLTTATASGAYPFLAEGGPRRRGHLHRP